MRPADTDGAGPITAARSGTRRGYAPLPSQIPRVPVGVPDGIGLP